MILSTYLYNLNFYFC